MTKLVTLAAIVVTLAAIVVTLGVAAPAGAITFGEIDGTRHPNVGALFADYDPDVPGLDLLCTGRSSRRPSS